MKKLTKYESRSIQAGASSGFIFAGIIAGISFLSGIFDGFTRPFRCR